MAYCDPGLRTNIIDEVIRDNNEFNLPVNILSVVCGPSMSGKTTYVLNLLFNTLDNRGQITKLSVLDPDEIHIFSPTTMSQTLYTKTIALRERYPNVCSEIFTYDSLDKLPNPDALSKDKRPDGRPLRKCIIIDDAIAENKQDKLIKYFTSGRHQNCDTFYLTQSFYEVPMMIRNQLNLVISFDRKPKTAEALYNIVNTPMDLKEFKRWYRDTKKDARDKDIPKVICKVSNGKTLRDGIAG